jgi:DNA-binding NarL/FixJ family response regulator
MTAKKSPPITVALVDDYDVVLKGLAHMFDQYQDRVVVSEIDATTALKDAVDIVMYDSFAQPRSDHHEIAGLVNNPLARRVVVYTWNFQPGLVASARKQGIHGYLSKTPSPRTCRSTRSRPLRRAGHPHTASASAKR